MIEKKCSNCQFAGRIKGQQTNICHNRALSIVAHNRKARNPKPDFYVKDSKQVNMTKLCDTDYWRPFTIWQRVRLWWWSVEIKTAKEPDRDYEAGSWKEVFEEEEI